MSEGHTNATTGSNEESDNARLRRLWSALLDTLLVEVSKPGAKASMLAVARSFLRNNNITAQRPADLRTGLAGLQALPFTN
jgi:hypothetical protein